MRLNLQSVSSVILGLAILTGTSGIPAFAYDPNDPYDSKCDTLPSKDGRYAYIANGGSISVSGYTVHVENWYSPRCNTNWARIWWNGGANVQTSVSIDNEKGDTESYPTNLFDLYKGGLSPSWTNMIDGSTEACVFVTIKANGQLKNDWGWCA